MCFREIIYPIHSTISQGSLQSKKQGGVPIYRKRETREYSKMFGKSVYFRNSVNAFRGNDSFMDFKMLRVKYFHLLSVLRI